MGKKGKKRSLSQSTENNLSKDNINKKEETATTIKKSKVVNDIKGTNKNKKNIISKNVLPKENKNNSKEELSVKKQSIDHVEKKIKINPDRPDKVSQINEDSSNKKVPLNRSKRRRLQKKGLLGNDNTFEYLQTRINEIKNREVLTKTAKKQLSRLKKLLSVKEKARDLAFEKSVEKKILKNERKKEKANEKETDANETNEKEIVLKVENKSENNLKRENEKSIQQSEKTDISKKKKTKSEDKNLQTTLNVKCNKTSKKQVDKKTVLKQNATKADDNKGKKEEEKIQQKYDEDDDEDDDDDDDGKDGVDDDADNEVNVDEDNGDDSNDNENDGDDNINDNGDEDDNDNDGLKNTKKNSDSIKNVNKNKPSATEVLEITSNTPEKKQRYVLFVGNLPFNITEEEIKNHFLKKASSVVSIRCPTKPGTKESRGFAYVEFTDNKNYEAALTLHHTILCGRRINVQYTTSGSKGKGNTQKVKAKNLKLHALRKAGKLSSGKLKANKEKKKKSV